MTAPHHKDNEKGIGSLPFTNFYVNGKIVLNRSSMIPGEEFTSLAREFLHDSLSAAPDGAQNIT